MPKVVAAEKNPDVPVIFFQAGDARHLPYTFWQARHWAGDSPLILLGDKSNRHYRGLEHVPIRDFASSVPRLRDRYIHISSNTPDFEFFCLARWLVIGEFARRQGLKEFLCLDCDVMLYEAPAAIVAGLPPCSMTLAWRGDLLAPGQVISPGESLFRDAALLTAFCETIFAFYENPAHVTEARIAMAQTVARRAGGISDMWFWTRFAQKNASLIENSWRPFQDGVLDCDISFGDGFRCRDGIKDIEFRDGKPYGFFEAAGRWVRFASLHFGGHTKKKMKQHLGRPAGLGLFLSLATERIRKGMRLHKSVLF